MGKAGATARIIGGTYLVPDHMGHHRCPVIGDHHYLQAIIEGKGLRLENAVRHIVQQAPGKGCGMGIGGKAGRRQGGHSANGRKRKADTENRTKREKSHGNGRSTDWIGHMASYRARE